MMMMKWGTMMTKGQWSVDHITVKVHICFIQVVAQPNDNDIMISCPSTVPKHGVSDISTSRGSATTLVLRT